MVSEGVYAAGEALGVTGKDGRFRRNGFNDAANNTMLLLDPDYSLPLI